MNPEQQNPEPNYTPEPSQAPTPEPAQELQPDFQQPVAQSTYNPEVEPQSFSQPLPQETQPVAQQFSAPVAAQAEANPGKTIGIVGLVFAFIGLSLVGLILSIVGYKKSKRVGMKNGVAVAGIWINSIVIALAIPIVLLFTLTAYSGVSQIANQASVATNLREKVNTYNTTNGEYPTYDEILTSTDSSTMLSVKEKESIVDATNDDPSEGKVGYELCYDDELNQSGAHIYTVSFSDKDDIKLYDTLGTCN